MVLQFIDKDWKEERSTDSVQTNITVFINIYNFSQPIFLLIPIPLYFKTVSATDTNNFTKPIVD